MKNPIPETEKMGTNSELSKNGAFIFLIGLIIASIVFGGLFIGYYWFFYESPGPLDNDNTGWIEDCSDISDWSEAQGTDFEKYSLGHYGAIESLTDSIVASNDVFTPDTTWWNPPSGDSTHRKAARIRRLPSYGNELIIQSIINFDPSSTSNPYTFQGGMDLILTGPSLEPLFQIRLADGAASSNMHQISHRAWYFTSAGVDIEILPPTLKANPLIFDGQFSIYLNQSTIEVFTPVSDQWIDLDINPETALQRGTPTFLVLYFQQNRQLFQPPPSVMNIDQITVDTRS